MSTPQQSGSSTTTIIQTAVNEDTDKRDVAGFLKRQFQQSLAFGTLIVLVIFFSIASPNFFTFSNIATVLLSTAVIGILALGTTFVIITGGIDLSIGTGMALCAVMTGVLITNLGLPVWVGVLGGIATGVLMGLVNGVNITFLRLPPFIATLAMMMIAGGLALVALGGPCGLAQQRGLRLTTGLPRGSHQVVRGLTAGQPVHHGLGVQELGGGHRIGQAERHRIGPGETVAGQGHVRAQLVLRAREQVHGAHVREQPDAGLGHGVGGPLRCDPDVRGLRDADPSAHDDAVHDRRDRLWVFEQQVVQPVLGQEEGLGLRRIPCSALGDHADVAARAEAALAGMVDEYGGDGGIGTPRK